MTNLFIKLKKTQLYNFLYLQIARYPKLFYWVKSCLDNLLGESYKNRYLIDKSIFINNEHFYKVVFGEKPEKYYFKNYKFTKKNKKSKKIKNIFYYCEHTSKSRINSGIQRVVRQLAKYLLLRGINLIPVTFNVREKKLEIIHQDKLLYNLSLFNGPKFNISNKKVNYNKKKNYIIIPELISGYTNPNWFNLKQFLKEKNFKSLSIFYDDIPFKNTFNNYSDLEIYKHCCYMRQILGFDIVLPISTHSANCLKSFEENLIKHKIKLKKNKNIFPVNLATKFKSQEKKKETRVKSNSDIYFLCVGSFEFRKNYLILIKTLNKLNSKSNNKIKLVIAGNKFDDKYFQLLQKHSNENVKFIISPSDEDLDSLYENCFATIYPSLEEGFGVPILESLYYLKPCICHNQGAMKEISRSGGCLSIDFSNDKKISKTILNLLNNNTFYKKKINECKSRVNKKWEDYANEVLSHF
jgi:glycosyltransferase involved in cell wall biosynthesis